MSNLNISYELKAKLSSAIYKIVGESSESPKLAKEAIGFLNDIEDNNINFHIPMSEMEIGFISYMGSAVNFKFRELEEFLTNKHRGNES